MSGMSMPTSVGTFIREAAIRFADKTALVFEGQTWSFKQLDDASSRVAAYLQSLGVERGQRVSLYSPNCSEWVIAYYGILKIGAVVNPLNLMLTPQEAAYAMKDCGAVAVFACAERIAQLSGVLADTQIRHCIVLNGEPPADVIDLARILEQSPSAFLPPEIQADEISTIGYTSGTTGYPKGAVLTHRAILMNTAMTATMHGRTALDTVVSALPCSHVYGNIVMNAAMAYGMTLVLHKTFDAQRVLQSIEQHRATLFEGVPTMYMYLLGCTSLGDYDLRSLTRCTVGGQTMPEAKMQQVEAALGCPLIELWGMTELGGLGTTHSLYGPRRHGSIGVPLPHLEVRVANSTGTGEVVPLGEVGELLIRGPMTMNEYLGQPEATRSTLDADGWLHSGDLVRQDAEGYLYVVDRLKDMIITGGFNIYPAELERVIAEYPGVALVAVGSIADEDKGELAKAYIVAQNGVALSLEGLDRHCRSRLAAYKVPRAYQLVDTLPMTSSGKILRRMLRTLDA
ncbi:class I adenylate-forming enzyme family protein [Pseudomonas sp. XK-1]|uniref:class I adenylate-forming enzyme family protein n=1 Tax=Pseudomonas sp. XK-1 TaxID=3136019 RepID=UPI00311A274E